MLLYSNASIADTDREQHATNQSELLKTLRELEAEQDEIKDISAKFSQKRYSPLLKKPIVSSGTYRSIPGLARWDTDKPHDSIMLIQTDRLKIYYPDQDTLEVYPVEKRLGELLANPRPDLDQWQASFELSRALPDALSVAMRESIGLDQNVEDYLLISLTPRDEEVAKLIERLIVVVDRKTGLSRAMAWSVGDEGERTEIEFTRIRPNTKIDVDDLQLVLPDTTRTVYPLGPIGAAKKKAK